MIQYYLDLEKQVKNIKEKRLSQGQIQKIYSTSYFLSLSVRAPGKTWHLYIGRGAGQEGIWLSDSPPESVLRRKDNFLEYLRRHLSSCSIIDVDIDNSDRIVRINYQKFGEVQSMFFFWKARKLYFAHLFQESPEAPFKLLLSWRGKASIVNTDLPDVFECFNEVGRRTDMKHDLHSPQLSTIEELLLDEKNAAALKGMTSNPTFLQRKKANIEDDLRKAQQWERLQKILDKGDSLDMYELKVGDHKIKFEGDLNPYERRNLIFQKIKKLKRGEGILNERLQSVTDQLAGKNDEPKKASNLPITKPVWGRDEKIESERKTSQTHSEYKVFKSEKYQLGVGLTSQGNDQLRSAWAGKEDIWIHLDGLKSAHVIIKMLNNSPLTPEILNLGASILAHFSHFNDEWIPILYTPVKNLKGVTGAPGMVTYKKEKHLRCPKVDVDQWFKEET